MRLKSALVVSAVLTFLLQGRAVLPSVGAQEGIRRMINWRKRNAKRPSSGIAAQPGFYMPQTMVERLFSRRNLDNRPVRAGDFLEARIDGAMCHYHAGEPMRDMAIEAGFKDGLPRVWDREKIYVLLDHHQPTLTQKLADENAVMRKEVERLGIQCFHDSEPGIAHQMMLDYGLVRPGELVVGNDSHTLGYGAVNAGAPALRAPTCSTCCSSASCGSRCRTRSR